MGEDWRSENDEYRLPIETLIAFPGKPRMQDRDVGDMTTRGASRRKRAQQTKARRQHEDTPAPEVSRYRPRHVEFAPVDQHSEYAKGIT
jgi:hypothetical protein